MSIIPPSLPWIRTAVSRVVDAIADSPVAAVTAAASIYPPPRPQPPPSNFCGIIHSRGTIEEITAPNTMYSLADARNKLIEDTNGHRSMVIVEKGVAAHLKPEMPTSTILDVLCRLQDSGYRELLGCDGHPKPRPSIRSRVVVEPYTTEIEVEQNGRWIPFAPWFRRSR
jgi:hypothetical protein